MTTLGNATPTGCSPGTFPTTWVRAINNLSVESWAGVGVLNRSLTNAPVSKSISAHLIDEPPTSTPIAKFEVANVSSAL
jgi:hypothetical protein